MRTTAYKNQRWLHWSVSNRPINTNFESNHSVEFVMKFPKLSKSLQSSNHFIRTSCFEIFRSILRQQSWAILMNVSKPHYLLRISISKLKALSVHSKCLDQIVQLKQDYRIWVELKWISSNRCLFWCNFNYYRKFLVNSFELLPPNKYNSLIKVYEKWSVILLVIRRWNAEAVL